MGYEFLTKQFPLPNGANFNHDLRAPAGKKILGGGYMINVNMTGIVISTSCPMSGADSGWKVVGLNNTGHDASLTIYANCATVES